MKSFLTKNRQLFLFCSVVLLFLVGVGFIQTAVDSNVVYNEIPVVENQEQEVAQEIVVETLVAPVEEASIVRYYYDINGDQSKLENALVYFEGVYRPNLGIDYSNNGESFDVLASASGTITKVSDDALLGWLVTIEHDYGIETTYQSLSEVMVEKDQKVSQGEVIGTSGENLYEADLGNHLHYVVEIDNIIINPESVIGLTLDKIS
ncbi:M23 family metallopeptidase [Tannockella kyphosi]|uniref:M23 family metallopeptidase n=1 Tax=Tannockella kyphosi TaxID=2899121 RepID=UPI002013B015|nr:M23 family metallopeptidase [Tannockella kyphosi]